MKLKDFTLDENNHFIAMEYYGFFLNRTFLILLTKDYIIGLKVNGLVSVERNKKKQDDDFSKRFVVRGDLNNPNTYIKDKYITEIENEDIFEDEILLKDKANFRIEMSSIKSATYNPKRKWGMSYYPHDGRVYVKTSGWRKREFIILGNQSGEKVASLIMKM